MTNLVQYFLICGVVFLSANFAICTNSSKRRIKRLTKGEMTTINKYLFQAAIYSSGDLMCAGSIIHPNYILTAAHCVDEGEEPEDLFIRAGSNYHNRDGFTSRVSKIIIHPQFDVKTFDCDIALLQLPGVGFTKELDNGSLAKIELPVKAHNKSQIYDVFLAGWGRTHEKKVYNPNNLREIKLELLPQQICEYLLSDELTEHMLCAGYLSGGKDACKGDSGGPLIKDRKIIGIVSWGYGCGRKLLPTAYTDVIQFKKWVYTAMKQNSIQKTS